jgi:hypothetical protein
MCQDLPRGASFWSFLFSIDKNLAQISRQKGCPCGGHLHCAHYPRKPRGGGDDLPEQYGYRLSFCCDRDGCRKRVTPPSVRFLGRKVYLGAVVILVAAMRQGRSSLFLWRFWKRSSAAAILARTGSGCCSFSRRLRSQGA